MKKIKQKTKPFAINVRFTDKIAIDSYNKLNRIKGRYSINDVILLAIEAYVNGRS